MIERPFFVSFVYSRNVGLYLYAGERAAIYADATWSKPRRSYNKCLHLGRAEEITFFAACMTAVNVKYSFIIRRALEGLAQLHESYSEE
jgi:hypothetical protein